MSSIGTVSSHADTDDEEGLGNSQKNDFDYFGAATNTQVLKELVGFFSFLRLCK